jgi:hypothetical protein
VWGGRAVAQSADVSSDAELSKDSVNPVTRHITVPLRYQAEFQDGPYKATKSTFELDQAVVPFRLNEDWALITRTKLPGIVEPPKKHGEHWTTGLGNGYTTFFLSPEHGEGLYWGGALYCTTPQRRTLRSACIDGARGHLWPSSGAMRGHG